MTSLAGRRFAAADVVALGAAVLALAVSVYLTLEHYDTMLTLACPESATINCQKVTTSSYSSIAGIPVAVLGLAYFVVMCALLAVPVRTSSVETLRLVGAGAGVAMVFYLVGVELLAVDAICLWCTSVHVLTLIMFVAVLWRRFSPTE